jgi:hypothetical protein
MTRWVEMADEELLAAVSAVQRECNAVESRMLRIVAELDERGLASERGFTNTAELLQTVQRVSSGTAKARVRVARKAAPGRTLQGEELPAAMSETAKALESAEISFEHAQVIERTLAALPRHLVAQHAEQLERDLAEPARVLDPDTLRKVGKNALALLDPDGPKPRDGAPTRNRLRLLPLGGGFEARGWFDQESAAIVQTALSPLAAPTGAHAAGDCDTPDCEHSAGESRPDPRSIAERNGDAVVELARRMLQVGELPTEAGARPQVTVTITLEDLRGNGAGLLEAGDGIGRGVIRAEDARRVACDAGVIPILLGSEGESLDVGRKQRVVHTALRRVLAERDGGCAFPGCGIPARWADAHHLRHWAHGGETSPQNTVLLCPRHHRLVHHGEWVVEMKAGKPEFRSPAWAGAPPGRNVLHRPDLLGRTPRPRRPVERIGGYSSAEFGTAEVISGWATSSRRKRSEPWT